MQGQGSGCELLRRGRDRAAQACPGLSRSMGPPSGIEARKTGARAVPCLNIGTTLSDVGTLVVGRAMLNSDELY
jgi:hypothetical protein